MIDLSRSTFYYRATTKTTKLSDVELVTLIEDIQDELPCYGYRRVTHELRRRGHLVNHKRVARVMRAAGLGIKPRRRYVRTTDSSHDSPIYPNLYRNVVPDRPDMVWVADFTYIRIATGFCYLAVILDACSRKVVGYALSRRLDTPLALAALRSALASTGRRQAASITPTAGANTRPRPERAGCGRPARLHERDRQPLPQCAGRELHEDLEGRGRLCGWLRQLCRCGRTIAEVHRRGLQLKEAALSPWLSNTSGI